MTVSRFENSVDLDHSVFHCTCKFLLIKFILGVTWKVLGMGFGYSILLWLILQVFFSSSADIFLK